MQGGCHYRVVPSPVKLNGRCFRLKHRPYCYWVKSEVSLGFTPVYSSPRRRRGALPRLHSGQGEIAPVVSAAGAVEPAGTIQS